MFEIRSPAFWVFALFIVGGVLFAVLEQSTLASLNAGGWLLSWILVLLYATPLAILIYRLDLYEREPMSLVLGALAWGALGALALASLANEGWGAFLGSVAGREFAVEWGAALTAPVTEEILKGAGVILIYLIATREIDDLMDGFVYGAMIGLGFAVLENVFYFVAVFAPEPVFGGELVGVLQGFFVRVIAGGLYGHVLYSALFGLGVAYFVTRRGEVGTGRRLAVAAGLILLGVAAHFLWNSPLLDFLPDFPLDGLEYLQLIGAAAIKGLPLLVFVLAMVGLARRREHRWLEAALVSEVGQEGLTAEEMATLRTSASRRRARREAARRVGGAAGRAVGRLQRAQINLAMVRTRVDEDDHPDLVAQRRYCATLREQAVGPAPAAPAGPAG